MSNFALIEESLDKAVKATAEVRRLSAASGKSIEVAVQKLVDLGVKPRKVSSNDRIKQLNKHLKRANVALDDSVEVDVVEDIVAEDAE